jgi:hypothetical protein
VEVCYAFHRARSTENNGCQLSKTASNLKVELTQVATDSCFHARSIAIMDISEYRSREAVYIFVCALNPNNNHPTIFLNCPHDNGQCTF